MWKELSYPQNGRGNIIEIFISSQMVNIVNEIPIKIAMKFSELEIESNHNTEIKDTKQ